MAEPPVRVGDVVPDVMPGDVELAVIPKPKRERMGDRMIVVGKPVVVAPAWEELRAGRGQLAALLGAPRSLQVVKTFKGAPTAGCDTLVLIGRPEDSEAMARCLPDVPFIHDSRVAQPTNYDQSYRLVVGRVLGQKRNVVLIVAPTPQGAFYAIQTLKQIAYAADGKIYIREGEIRDWPTFRGRGGKRTTHPWVYGLKCNLHYEHGGRQKVREDHFGNIWIAGIFPARTETPKGPRALDATPAGIARIVEQMKNLRARGASDYRVHVDDQPMKLTSETDKLFHGDYYAAMRHLLKAFYKEMKRVDPKATLYFCAQTYWTLTPYEEYARRLWAGETPPKDFAMAINGPQVTGTPIPTDEVAMYSKAFGASKPALIVDWHGRGKSFGPIEPRAPELARYAVGVAPGAGTATMRATRLDWGWNPEAYDPDRSLMLACREFAGFENWKKLYDLVTALEYAAPGAKYEPRKKALAKFRSGLDRAEKLLAELKALPNGGMNGRIKPPTMKDPAKMINFAQNVVFHIEPTLKAMKEKKLKSVLAYGFKEAVAVRARRAPEVDGVLDEKAWRGVPEATGFVSGAKPVAGDWQTTFRCLYDSANLYIGWRMNAPRPVNLKSSRTALGVRLPPPGRKQTGPDMRGIFALHGWECVALMLDPAHTHRTDYEFQLDAAGRCADGLFDNLGGSSPNGLFWNSGWKRAVKIVGKGWTAEMAIPWKDLGVTPRKGMVMGLQVWRSGDGMRSNLWSVTPRWWGVQSPRQFGHLILK